MRERLSLILSLLVVVALVIGCADCAGARKPKSSSSDDPLWDDLGSDSGEWGAEPDEAAEAPEPADAAEQAAAAEAAARAQAEARKAESERAESDAARRKAMREAMAEAARTASATGAPPPPAPRPSDSAPPPRPSPSAPPPPRPSAPEGATETASAPLVEGTEYSDVFGNVIGSATGNEGLGRTGEGPSGAGAPIGSAPGIGTIVGSGKAGGKGRGGYGAAPRRDVPALKLKPTDAPVTLERFPTIEAPPSVKPAREFAVMVSLTEEQLTPETRVQQGTTTPEGALAMTLPPSEVDSWTIEVVLAAAGFSFRDGANTATMTLPRAGDSTPALFHLTADAPAGPQRETKLRATLWHDGTYLAKITHPITVTGDGTQMASKARSIAPESASEPATGPATETTRTRGVSAAIDLTLRKTDLTVYLLRGVDPDRPERTQLLLNSPAFGASVTYFEMPEGLIDWLDLGYARFSLAAGRRSAEPTDAQKTEGLARARGFGRELYRKFAPDAFKQAFWALHDKLGDSFQSIQVFTNDPMLPWELMRPVRADGSDEQEFLGVDFRLARWHITGEVSQLDRPPQSLDLQELVVISPSYEGAGLLDNQAREVEALAAIPGYRALPGRFDDVRGMFDALPQGIVHFAGHGMLRSGQTGIAEYAVVLEDAELDLGTWRGLYSGSTETHPFFFFNACDLGQSQRVANFVNGWAPAVLEAGASGYVGSLWPLGDRGAAEFSVHFYRTLGERIADGAQVADLMRTTRQQFYETGDPTFLAYVYYGDPFLSIARHAE